MSTEIYYFSGTGNSLHVAKELQRRIPETSLVPIVSLLDKESIETRAETVGFVFPQYAATVPKVVAKVLKKFDPTSAGYLFAIATRGGTVCRAFADVDKLLSKKGRRLDSYFLLTMPSGSEPLVETFSEYITEERIARLESEMLARLDAIQGIITAQEVNREEDLSGLDVPPPDIIKPIMPFIKILGPILLPLGKLAESSFDCIISIIWGAGGGGGGGPPPHTPHFPYLSRRYLWLLLRRQVHGVWVVRKGVPGPKDKNGRWKTCVAKRGQMLWLFRLPELLPRTIDPGGLDLVSEITDDRKRTVPSPTGNGKRYSCAKSPLNLCPKSLTQVQ